MREISGDDAERARELSQFAFGTADASPPIEQPPQTKYGAFTAGGLLVGTASDLHRHQWWGGKRVAAADVNAVAVLPEARGGGIARALLGALLEGAQGRGAAVSSLFPTVAAPYSSTGWATVGVRRLAEIPTALLPARRSSGDLTVRPGDETDRVAAGRLYTEAARIRNGMQAREVAPFGPPGFLDEEVDGITVVEQDGQMAGFFSWNRGVGHRADAVLTVVDFVATTRESARELISVLASWRNVAPTTRFRALLSGVVSDELPLEAAAHNRIDRLMHRPVDVARAVSARGWPPGLRVAVRFELNDDLAPWNAGVWELEIGDGEGHLEPSSKPSGLRLDIRGFTMLCAGAASPPMLVEAGLVEAAAGADLVTLSPLVVGPAPESLDHF